MFELYKKYNEIKESIKNDPQLLYPLNQYKTDLLDILSTNDEIGKLINKIPNLFSLLIQDQDLFKYLDDNFNQLQNLMNQK